MALQRDLYAKENRRLRAGESVDIPFLLILLALLAVGLAMLYSASYAQSQYDTGYTQTTRYLQKQAVCAVIGLAAMALLSRIPADFWYRMAWPLYGASILLLLSVLVFGESVNGAQRWINIAGLQFQPSELAKFTLILLFARLTRSFGSTARDFKRGVLGFGGALMGILIPLALEKHLSAIMLMGMVAVVMMFVAGTHPKWLLAGAGAAMVFLVVYITIMGYAGDRVTAWLHPEQDPADTGYRLPSAFDNRPLNFEEFEQKINQVIYVSATPADYEKEHSSKIVEQVIRPTGLVDPEIIVKPVKGQVDDLIGVINEVTPKNQRVLVTTLTKKMAESLTNYLHDVGIKVKYLHSDIETIERMEIIRDLRLGVFDVLVGINLLREGLDIPEVSVVAILDADKEGFLRSETSLVQTVGRAARNAEGRVIMYADTITGSMQRAIDETNRRRKLQTDYNKEHGITPKTIQKDVRAIIQTYTDAPQDEDEKIVKTETPQERIANLTLLMQKAADALEFEQAARYRDEITRITKQLEQD